MEGSKRRNQKSRPKRRGEDGDIEESYGLTPSLDMEEPVIQDPEPVPELFRHSKRRKVYRKKGGAEADEEQDASATSYHSPPAAAPTPMTVDELIARVADDSTAAQPPVEESQLSVQEIIRHRRAVQRRRTGIEFRNHPSVLSEPTERNLVVRDGDAEDDIPEDIRNVISRFAPQTGQVTDETNKHMLAYIDAEIDKIHRHEDQSSGDYDTMNSDAQRISKLEGGRQPAALGRLHEIDLGPDATARNIARTEAAQRRLDGQSDIDSEKPRLRKDGKPFRRKRRTSTDIKRDKLVEEVMRESRLEIYDDEDAAEGDADDREADDMIAEQFRREFLDAVSNRRRRKAPASAAKVNGKPVQTESRGPKLGGSRSARAKIREKELEEAAKGKKR